MLKAEIWEPMAHCTVEGDRCVLTPIEGAGCWFNGYDHFRVGASSGWLSGYWREVLSASGKFQRQPLCPVPFSKFEVVEQTEGKLVLRIMK